MRQEHVRERGRKAIRRNCLAGAELKREDKMGGFGTKCRFRFSKALLSTTQPPHQNQSQNIAKNCRLPISNCQLIKFAVISEEEARKKILEAVQPLPARRLPISKSLDFFAAEDHIARLPLPNFDNSAMDGFADVASSCRKGERLRITGEQPAGPDRRLQISPGEAVRIFTGAPMPAGADAVVMQEDVTPDGDEIVINTD